MSTSGSPEILRSMPSARFGSMLQYTMVSPGAVSIGTFSVKRYQSGSALRNLSKDQQYGWLWNSAEYPWNGRKVRAFFAAGNGGQIFLGFPDLDLVIGFTGGNYADAAAGIPGRVLVPQWILPAVH